MPATTSPATIRAPYRTSTFKSTRSATPASEGKAGKPTNIQPEKGIDCPPARIYAVRVKKTMTSGMQKMSSSRFKRTSLENLPRT